MSSLKFISCLCLTLLMSNIYATQFVLITDLGASAETIALGNIDGIAQTSTAVFNNPANLDYIAGQSVSFFSSRIMNEVDYYNVSLGSRLNSGHIGFGIYDQSVGGIPKTIEQNNLDKTHEQISSFDFKNTALKFSYQTSLRPNVSVGVSYAYYIINFAEYGGSGSNIDIGLRADFKRFYWSLYIQNMIFNQHVIYNHNESELLPFSISNSACISLADFKLMPQFKFTKNQLLFSQGISYSPPFLSFLTLRSGYREQLDYLSQKHKKYTFGLGLRLFDITIDYAYERSDYFLLDHNSYISFNINL